MNRGANGDVFFLHDEEFDFDVSLSPASSNGEEDEDEVFVGAVTHTEKCVSVHVESQLQKGHMRGSWSPLTGDQLEAVCEEAHKLANQLQSSELSQEKGSETVAVAPSPPTPAAAADATDPDEFVQDAETKLGVFAQPNSTLSPIKRQTFCVHDSPMKQLPPAVQRRLLSRGSAVGTPPSSRAPPTRRSLASTNSLARSTAAAVTISKQGTSTPASRPKAPTRSGLRGRTSLGVGVVLPSKPAAPNVSAPVSRNKVEKTRLQAPAKMTSGYKRSPSSQPSSKVGGSSEDLLSDSASVASDVSDTSVNSSLLGKRTLPPPTKSVKNSAAAVKAPRLQSRSVMDRRNTSSSSSSVSSFNSSMSLSPTKGKLNSSLNQSSCVSTAPGSISRPAVNGRNHRPTIVTVDPVPSSAKAADRRSLSTQARKPQELERVVKAARSTPLKKAEATPIRRVLERTASVPTVTSAKPLSSQRTKSKPEAMVAPTPVGGGRRLSSQADVSGVLKPKRLASVSSLESVPQKPVLAAPSTPSAGLCRPLQAKAVRPTGLPTPVKRRMSTLPLATPTNPNRTSKFHLKSDSSPAPVATSVTKAKSSSPAKPEETEGEISVIQTLHLEDDKEEVRQNEEKSSEEKQQQEDEGKVPPPSPPPATAAAAAAAAAPSPSPPKFNQPERTDAAGTAEVEPESIKNLIELETAEEKSSKTQEVLLLDLPAPALHPQEKLLIDLTNTPDLIRTNNKTCTGAQLIDLSSPLIKWSPEDKRENNAPLINLSF